MVIWVVHIKVCRNTFTTTLSRQFAVYLKDTTNKKVSLIRKCQNIKKNRNTEYTAATV